MTRGVYLLCISPKIYHAGHYTGYSEDIEARVATHLAGIGSPLIRAAIQQGSTVTLARVWENQDRAFERHLKTKGKNAPHRCPICNSKQAAHLYQPP